MRTKVLLMAAAALAAGAITSNAQVYSQNIVGYVNVPATASHLSMVTPPLDFDGSGTNNALTNLFTTPTVGDTLYVWNGAGYNTLSYLATKSGNVWKDQNGALAGGDAVNPGEGFFYLPAANETNVFVGQVLQGSLTNHYMPPAGQLGMVGSEVPESGGLQSVLGYTPTVGDTVYFFTNGTYNTYSYLATKSGNQWKDQNGSVGEPIPQVGQGFWIIPAGSTPWVETFTNN